MIAPRQLFSSIIIRLRAHTSTIGICCFLAFLAGQVPTQAQTKKVRVAVPGYTIAVLSFLAAKTNGYYTSEGLDVELIAMRAPTANLALLAGNVEFSAVPLAGLTTAVRGAPLKLIFCQFDKPQHSLFARAEFQNVTDLRGKKLAVSGLGSIDDILLREALAGNGLDPGRDVTILAMAPQTLDSRLSPAGPSMHQCLSRRCLFMPRSKVSRNWPSFKI